MNLRSCSLNNPGDDMVDSEIIEKQIYAFFPLSNIKKEKTKQVKIQEGGQIISPPPLQTHCSLLRQIGL